MRRRSSVMAPGCTAVPACGVAEGCQGAARQAGCEAAGLCVHWRRCRGRPQHMPRVLLTAVAVAAAASRDTQSKLVSALYRLCNLLGAAREDNCCRRSLGRFCVKPAVLQEHGVQPGCRAGLRNLPCAPAQARKKVGAHRGPGCEGQHQAEACETPGHRTDGAVRGNLCAACWWTMAAAAAACRSLRSCTRDA